jgi:hypothetical protein
MWIQAIPLLDIGPNANNQCTVQTYPASVSFNGPVQGTLYGVSTFASFSLQGAGPWTIQYFPRQQVPVVIEPSFNSIVVNTNDCIITYMPVVGNGGTKWIMVAQPI